MSCRERSRVCVGQAMFLIAADILFSTEGSRKPVIVILHSFMAFKDWGWFPYVEENIVGAGFATVMFNFSRHGVGENPNRITEFECFQRNTITHEIEDTRVVLEAINRGVIGNGVIDAEKIILLGHSRGGGIAIATSAERQDVEKNKEKFDIIMAGNYSAHVTK